MGLIAAVYGAICYVIFLGSFLYAVGFVGDVIVPKTIDSGQSGAPAEALLIDLLLLGAFAVQHSVMARPGFKAVWTKIVPRPIESLRSFRLAPGLPPPPGPRILTASFRAARAL